MPPKNARPGELLHVQVDPATTDLSEYQTFDDDQLMQEHHANLAAHTGLSTEAKDTSGTVRYVPSDTDLRLFEDVDPAKRRRSARHKATSQEGTELPTQTAHESENEDSDEEKEDISDEDLAQQHQGDGGESEDSDDEDAGAFEGNVATAALVSGLRNTAAQHDPQVSIDDQTIQAVDYMREYRETFIYLADRITGEEETENKRPRSQYESFLRQGVNILCAMEPEIAISIMDGTIPLQASSPVPRQRAFQWLCDTEKEWKSMKVSGKVQYQPSIYGQFLTDDYGNGPNEEELAVIIQKLRKYARCDKKDAKWAHRIDQQLNDTGETLDWEGGDRRYLPNTTHRWKHVQTLRNFCNAVSSRLHDPPRADYRPRPLAEYGYTNNTHRRFKEHTQHEKSNRLMNLTEAICVKYFPQYGTNQFVLFKIFQHEQGAIAEVLINRIGKGTISSGYGFSHHPAGLNKLSAGKVPAAAYTDYTADALKYTPFREAHRHQMKKYQELTDNKRKEKEKTLAHLDSQIEGTKAKTRQAEETTQKIDDGTHEVAAGVFKEIEKLSAVVATNLRAAGIDRDNIVADDESTNQGTNEADNEADDEAEDSSRRSTSS